MKQITLVVMSLFFISLSASAAVPIKKLGNSNAPKGGTFYYALSAEPKTLHPINSTDAYARQVQGYVMDSLMTLNSQTYEFEPGLATDYKSSKNKTNYTFFLRKGVKFHDGTPFTAKDVKFSYEALLNGKFKTAHIKPYFENIKNIEVLDKYTVRFNIKKKYFNNFRVLAGLRIVPHHFYKNPKAKLNKTLLGSGAYKIGKYIKGKSLELVRNPDWWGYKTAHLKGTENYNRVLFRFIKEDTARLEYLKKGRIDFGGLTPEQYIKKTKGKPWGTTVLKKKVKNKAPKSYGYVGWNLKDDKFKDKNVRRALAHLMNRKLMNEKFLFNMSLLATGPWYRQSPYANRFVKPFRFNPKRASRLFKKSGWKDTNKDGVLDKKINGKLVSFKFTLLFANPDGEKYLTVYKEDLKKAGVHMKLKRVEWNSLLKSIDEKRFEAINLGWGGGSVHNDPKQIWHSSSSAPGGSNFISYSNPKVDKLIDKGRLETNTAKRKKIYRKVYKMIADDAPYAFMFVGKYSLYAHSKKIKFRKPTYKYDIGQSYWWIQP